ncbi:MAG: 2-amino-4-hydroxy-6-hydroxymethyldihydropteridine diphosphokinase [Ignavibacteriaceae bacterium]
MFKNFAYIALGSNRGDKLNYIKKAVALVNENPECSVETVSSAYETLPYGVKEQENFLNAAMRISTGYGLHDLLTFLKDVEKEIGREKTVRWGPREIDLDLLFYNDMIYSDEKITVPHKEVTKRDFVLVPLCEIAPGLIHPAINKKICDICLADSEKNVIRKIPDKIL